METKCHICKATLTTADGKRVESANFGPTRYKKPRNTNDITWALCDECLDLAQRVTLREKRA
jgi:hypothetical protein